MTKNWKKFTVKIIIYFLSKIAIYISLGLHKGRLSYRRSLQPSKENIHPALQNVKFLPFFLYLRVILPSWILIQPTKINAYPDPKYWQKGIRV
jgi:hypothetical protein